MFNKLQDLILIKNLGGKELSDEKIHDFKRLLVAQALVIGSLFLLELFSFIDFTFHIQISESIFFAFLVFYVFLLWDMLRNYTGSRKIVFLNFVFIMGVFFVGV